MDVFIVMHVIWLTSHSPPDIFLNVIQIRKHFCICIPVDECVCCVIVQTNGNGEKAAVSLARSRELKDAAEVLANKTGQCRALLSTLSLAAVCYLFVLCCCCVEHVQAEVVDLFLCLFLLCAACSYFVVTVWYMYRRK